MSHEERRDSPSAGTSSTPLVVVGGRETWPGGAVEALLRGNGYRLRRVSAATETISVIQDERPDLVVLTVDLDGRDGLAVCRALRDQDWFSTTPLLFLCTDGRANELAALEAGAWDVIRCPPDPLLFLARVRNAVQTKRKADQTVNRGLIDQMTGCYNRAGLETRLKEEILHARRHKEPLTCCVVEIEPLRDLLEGISEPETRTIAFRAVTGVLRMGCRRSDILGRIAELSFGIVAPATDRAGARRLATRVARAFQKSPVRIGTGKFSSIVRPVAGITVRREWSEKEERPESLVEDAAHALVQAKAHGVRYRIYPAEGDAES